MINHTYMGYTRILRKQYQKAHKRDTVTSYELTCLILKYTSYSQFH